MHGYGSGVTGRRISFGRYGGIERVFGNCAGLIAAVRPIAHLNGRRELCRTRVRIGPILDRVRQRTGQHVLIADDVWMFGCATGGGPLAGGVGDLDLERLRLTLRNAGRRDAERRGWQSEGTLKAGLRNRKLLAERRACSRRRASNHQVRGPLLRAGVELDVRRCREAGSPVAGLRAACGRQPAWAVVGRGTGACRGRTGDVDSSTSAGEADWQAAAYGGSVGTRRVRDRKCAGAGCCIRARIARRDANLVGRARRDAAGNSPGQSVRTE